MSTMTPPGSTFSLFASAIVAAKPAAPPPPSTSPGRQNPHHSRPFVSAAAGPTPQGGAPREAARARLGIGASWRQPGRRGDAGGDGPRPAPAAAAAGGRRRRQKRLRAAERLRRRVPRRRTHSVSASG